MLIRRLARPLLASTFVVDGVQTLMHPDSRVKEASTLVRQGEQTLPTEVAAKLPSDPSTLVKVTAATQVAGGTLLALGKAPRLAALALAATVVPATVTEQNFWSESDPERKSAKRTAFLKDVGLLGGLIIASADTAGKPSLGWRGRRAAHTTAATVSGALPFAGTKNGTGEALLEQLQHAADRGRELAGTAATKGAALAETAQQRGPGWAETAKSRSAELAEVAKHRGAELADVAKHRGAEVADVAKHRGAEFADIAKQRGSALAETAQHRGPEWADVAKHRSAALAAAAQQRGPVWADLAKHRGAEAAERAKHRGAALGEVSKHRGRAKSEQAYQRGAEWADLAKHRAAEFADITKHRGAAIAEAAQKRGTELAETSPSAARGKKRWGKSKRC
ncbi:DoxX family protein [Nocardia donostiensis]|uniref:DoxX family protein n=1 Tax=Nocardia donostiensis TaxID=1538463 RepID=A0A1V2THC8_9NOCA|nr:DoxX family protein [Nocardia donostiensis]ONM48915.1 DoxX family protein [Nocardia donostiensis]OQS15464.1 DoxX family protein [Nocardia donostiensis]OQS22829.1 DoxX family protein [Nocardia donostiensis]